MFDDKENVSSNVLKPRAVDQLTKPKGGAFGRLLGDATNQIRSEQDSKLAMRSQVDEAVEMVGEWIREEADQQLAKKLASTFEEETKTKKALEVAMGESEALRVAVEERRRVKEEAQAKLDIARRDEEFAKKMSYDEQMELEAMKKRLHEDEQMVQDMQAKEDERDRRLQAAAALNEASAKSFKPVAECKSDDKQSSSAGDKYVREEKEDFVASAAERAAEKVRRQQIERDFELARQSQQELTTSNKMDKFHQERADFALSRRLAVKAEREEHRRKKRLNVLAAITSFPTESLIASQWEKADAEVEDVCDGICITLLLPNIVKVKVSSTGSGKKVFIDAARMVMDGALASPDNSQYIAEFKIEGKDVRIVDEDVSYEYSSETGLLHVYVESVSLDGEAGAGRADEKEEKDGESRSASSKKGFVSAIKSNLFSRVFGGSGNKSSKK